MFFTVLTTWFRGLLALALVIGGIALLKKWVDDLPREEIVPVTALGPAEAQSRPLASLPERIDAWRYDPDRSTAPLIWGGLLLLLAVGGRLVSPWLWRRDGTAPSPGPARTDRLEVRGGRSLHVETYGSESAPPLILVHGLGSDRTQWLEAIEDLSGRHRVIVYDLLGHGRSSHPRDADYSLEAMARDLDAVMTSAAREKVLLVGHSMGGMIALTWCRLHKGHLRDRLAGLVLVHTSPRNPFETMAPVPLHERIRKPLHEPLLRAASALAPLVRLMSRLAYWNGSTHWDNAMQAFAGHETREQLDRTSRIAARIDPVTQARCALALARYDATDVLGSIDVPTLVVAADKDGVTVPEAGAEIVGVMGDAEHLLLQPARHMGFMEWREGFAEAVGKLGRASREDTREPVAARSPSPSRRRRRAPARSAPARP